MSNHSLSASNFKNLKCKYPDIYHFITHLNIDLSEIFLNESRSGDTILKVKQENRGFYIHSPSNPKEEAKRFIKEQKLSKGDKVILYGLGFMYHLNEILDEIGPKGQVTVFEGNINIFYTALKTIDCSNLFLPQVKVELNINNSDFINKFGLALNNVGGQNGKLIVHKPSLRAQPEELQSLKVLLQQWQLKTFISPQKITLMTENFKSNYCFIKKDQPVNNIFAKFKGKPAILVSAGPSLDKNIHELKDIGGKAVVFSVGTALEPLIKAGVNPDFVVITDPSSAVLKQVENRNCGFSLIYLPTTYYRVIINHLGSRYIAYQEGWNESEKIAAEMGLETVQTGGSVATTMLDIAIRTGAGPIIFVGQDLAYSGNRTHAQNSIYSKQGVNLSDAVSIPGNIEEYVYTSLSWMTYLEWIQKRILCEPDCIFINATGGGAFIKGTVVMTLAKAIEDYIS